MVFIIDSHKQPVDALCLLDDIEVAACEGGGLSGEALGAHAVDECIARNAVDELYQSIIGLSAGPYVSPRGEPVLRPRHNFGDAAVEG